MGALEEKTYVCADCGYIGTYIEGVGVFLCRKCQSPKLRSKRTGAFCKNCGTQITGVGIKSSKTGHQYCSTMCRNVGDSTGGTGGTMEHKQKFACQCGEVFSTTDDLMRHKSEGLCEATKTEAHKEVEEQVDKESKKLEWKPPYQCGCTNADGSKCGATFESDGALKAHKRVLHAASRGAYKCPKCERVFTFVTYVRNHLEKAHNMTRHDADELMKKEAVGSKAKPQKCVSNAIIEAKEAKKFKTEVGKSLGVKGEAGRALDRYADKVAKLEEVEEVYGRTRGFFCNNCCIIWVPEKESKDPTFCTDCGAKLGKVARRSIKL